jgi:hypothetical protein
MRDIEMSTDRLSDGEQLRATAEAIATRIEQDPDFAKQIRDDPKGALLSAGVPEAQISDDLFRAIDMTDDVTGYSICAMTCGPRTCGPISCGRNTCATRTST